MEFGGCFIVLSIKQMRVLQLPYNSASSISNTVRGLREIGVEARGLCFAQGNRQNPEGIKMIEHQENRWSFKKLKNTWDRYYYFLNWVRWADVLHWYWDADILPNQLDLKYVKYLNKPAVIEWVGSDIRIPEIEMKDNPYYANAFNNGYEFAKLENFQTSYNRQKKFYDAGFEAYPYMGVEYYLQKEFFPNYHQTGARIVLSDYEAIYPSELNVKPLIVHSPSAKVTKGTPYVLQAIENLKDKYNFEFKLIHNLPRSEALKLVSQADIFLDQFILGSYGLASIEAMAMGKPTLCYIKPYMQTVYPNDLPIVNANPDNLTEKLGFLLENPLMRNQLGKQSRAYTEKHNDMKVVGHQLVKIYEEVIRNKRKNK